MLLPAEAQPLLAAFRPPKRTARFTWDMVLRLVGQFGLGCRPPHGSPTGLGPDEYRPGWRGGSGSTATGFGGGSGSGG